MADRIKEEYKDLDCYKKMDETHQKEFDKLANYYGSILNQGPDQKVTVYTSHDFDRHCFDLYRIISMYLLRGEGIQQLTQEELYLLNLSVLLHDISMCRGGYENNVNSAFDRDIHALQSAQWIQHEYDRGDTPLYRSGLTADQVEIICNICQAHSTLKNRETPSGLFDSALKYKKDGKTGEIRVKALAGILRIADELDVTRHRLARAEEMDRLLTARADDGRPEVKEFIRENERSRKHFRRLLLIRSLERCEDNITEVALKLDAGQVRKRMEEGDEANLADDLCTIQNKIQEELDSLWSEVLVKESAGASHLISLKKVVWGKEDEQYIEHLLHKDVPDPPVDLQLVLERAPHNPDIKDGAEDMAPSTEGPDGANIVIGLLDSSLSQKISKYVKEHYLLNVGHYELNTTYCARDWIDTTRLLDDSDLATDIISVFSDHIWTTFRTEDFTIVGLDLIGARTAAQIGFILQKPFTYVIPARQHSQVDSHEIDIPDIPAEHKVVLITDSIITGLTTSDIIEKNYWAKRVLAIYTIFYRSPKLPQGNKTTCLPYTAYALNADFPAEIAPVSACPYGGVENCRAMNRKLL